MKLRTTLIALALAANCMAQGIIDTHCHLITPRYVATLQRQGLLLDEGFPLPQWSADRHLAWMDQAGIATSVLTLPAPYPLWGSPDENARCIREANEEAAELKRRHPGCFKFCASLPLPDVQAALREAAYALDTLGADGIRLATNARGQYLGAAELDTLFGFLNQRRAVVILHPHRPEPVNRQVMQQTPLALQEYLSETTRAVANMVGRNVLARFPGVRIVVPHCGAYLPLAVPRMKSLVPVMQANRLMGDVDWEANLAALYYDLAGAHSPEVIRMMLTITTPDHLLYGSDYPYATAQALTAGLQRMKQYLSEESDLQPFRKMILEQNARRLFGDAVEQDAVGAAPTQMVVRLAEIEVHAQYLSEYLAYAHEVDRLSVEREAGVVCLFPMQHADDSTRISILEIYASEEAYRKHVQTAHFLKYKQGTLHMVKSLRLPTMQPLDVKTMGKIFRKMN